MTLEEFVLSTLSFYEPMTFSRIILDFNGEALKAYPNFDREELQATLKNLEKKKLVKPVTIDKEVGWIRIHPKRNLISRLKRLFSL